MISLIVFLLVHFVSCDFVTYKYNPILRATGPESGTYQCEENIYSQEVFELEDGSYAMLYGGWDDTTDCHDRIFLATSRDLSEWRKYPNDESPKAVLDHGTSNHVNDPSVVYVNSTWYMFYTDAIGDQSDRVWLATSTSLTHFEKVREIVGPGNKGSWDEIKVGRPVIHVDPNDKNKWYLWYDGTGSSLTRCVGLSISTDQGETWNAYSNNPLYCAGGGIDVKYVESMSQFVLVEEGGDGVHMRTSNDGIVWSDSQVIFKSGSGSYDQYGTVVPSLFLTNGSISLIWFGGAQVSGWDRNNIAVAVDESAFGGPFPSGGGCTDCTERDGGVSCSEACGYREDGTCAVPGSTDPSKCCSCSVDPCSQCLTESISDCHTACTGMGYPGGYCTNPWSKEPSKCCTCMNPVAKISY